MVLEVDEETKEALREAFKELVEPVECLIFVSRTEHCHYCEDTIDLFRLLEETSNGKIKVKVYYKEENPELFDKYNVDRIPTVILADGLIRYTGIPAGEEVRGVVETLIRISSGNSGLDEDTIKSLREELRGKAYIEVIVTPTCPYCPYAALLANMFAYVSGGKIISDIVEALENPDIADEYGVTAVPAVIVNGNMEFVGVPQEEDLLKAVIRYQMDEVPVPWHRDHPHSPPGHHHE